MNIHFYENKTFINDIHLHNVKFIYYISINVMIYLREGMLEEKIQFQNEFVILLAVLFSCSHSLINTRKTKCQLQKTTK